MAHGYHARLPAFQDVPAVGWRWIVPVAGLAGVALVLSAYLSYVSFSGGSVVGCGEGDILGCGHVLGSRWSRWLGVPVSVAAVCLYGVLLVAVAFLRGSVAARVRGVAWCVVVTLAAAAGGAAVWFIALLATVVGTICVYCLAAHACGLTVATAVLVVNVRRGSAGAVTASKRRRRVACCMVPAALALAVLVAGQLLVVPKTFEIVAVSDAGVQGTAMQGDGADVSASRPTSQRAPVATAPAPRREVSVAGGRITFDLYDHPFLGRTDATYAIVEFFDYTCPDCRKMHRQFQDVRRRYPGRIVVVAMPAPLCTDCNRHIAKTLPLHKDACELARLALAVWRTDAAAFEPFHQWLMDGATAPALGDARAQAQRRVGSKPLETALADPTIEVTLRRYVDVFQVVPGTKNLPKLVLPDLALVGLPATSAELSALLEQHLHIGPERP